MSRSARDVRVALSRLGSRGTGVLVAAVVVVAILGLVAGVGLRGAGAPAIGPASAEPTMLVAVVPPTPTDEPAPTPTDEPNPTGTPEPTPTPTQEPTPTPVPTATSTPEFTLHVPILTYHVIAPWSVASAYSVPSLDVDPAVFDQQLAMLKANGWRSITVDRLYGYLAARQRPPRKTFVVTIDDGHDDGYTYALPILQKYGFVATYYVVAGRVGWTHTLTWDQIATLQTDGMEIGNHTMTHVSLTSLSAPQVAFEIDAAQQLLASHLGAMPTTFAYPYGTYNSAIASAVRAAGLRMALTTVLGTYESWSRQSFIPRIPVRAGLSADGLLARIAADA